MPRISITKNYEALSSGQDDDPMNTNRDYCKDCYADLSLGGIATKYGVPDDAVEMECDHPGYEDWYECEKCGCQLTEKDY